MNLPESIKRAQAKGLAPVIAEIKRLIPKLAVEKKRPRDGRSAALLAQAYLAGGACGISLVTEKRYFGGDPEKDIPELLQATALPLLIKDFILSRRDVDFYAGIIAGVDHRQMGRVTLLLHAHLLGGRLLEMLEYIYSRGMHALVETRGRQDLPYLNNLGEKVMMVGINNKNIDELEMGEDRIQLSPELVGAYRQVSKKALIISQSAHQSPKDVLFSLNAGADAVLVGTALMLSPDPASTLSLFVGARGERR